MAIVIYGRQCNIEGNQIKKIRLYDKHGQESEMMVGN